MRPFIGAVMLGLTLGAATAASAGVYSDDMGRCLARSATEADKAVLTQWMFSEMSLNPALKPVVTISPQQRKDLEKKGALLFQRLLLEDCRKETTAGLKNEGGASIQASFGVLGQIAMRGLMTDPAVMEGVTGMAGYLDKDRWDAIAKEAGAQIGGN